MDAAFTIHKDMLSHTRDMRMLGKGMVFSGLLKQKFNTKSLIEAKLVDVDNVMPQIIWKKAFLQAQGFEANDGIVH